MRINLTKKIPEIQVGKFEYFNIFSTENLQLKSFERNPVDKAKTATIELNYAVKTDGSKRILHLEILFDPLLF